jgi:hypothetical protein
MKEQVASAKTMGVGMVGLCLLVLGVVRADAATIAWHWAGPVNGYICLQTGACTTERLDTVVPLGTPVDVFVTFDPASPTHPNPAIPCLWGNGDVSMQVLGQSYLGLGFVWVDGHGFGPGTCHPGENSVEIVVPSWGEGGQAPLPGGWAPFGSNNGAYLAGLFWGADDLTSVQPFSIASQLPFFFRGLGTGNPSFPERFTVNLQAVPDVPEPATWLLLSTGLSAAPYWLRRRQSKRAGLGDYVE